MGVRPALLGLTTGFSIYSSTLSAGTTVGSIIAGAITINETWQAFFWLSCALTGATAVLMLFTLPETMYDRSRIVGTAPTADDHVQKDMTEHDEQKSKSIDHVATEFGHDRVRSRPNFSKVLKTYPVKSYTEEPVWKLVLRPMALIILPSTLWASLVMAVTIGFLIAVSSNVSVAFSSMYGFSTWQIGLTVRNPLISLPTLFQLAFPRPVFLWISIFSSAISRGIRSAFPQSPW